MKKVFLIIYISLIINTLHAAGKFEFTPLARQAYEKTLALKFDEANVLLAQLRKNEPQNLVVFYIENHQQCLRIFISEDKSEFDRLSADAENRLKALKNGDPNSPYCLFTQAQVRLFSAMNRAKFGNYLDAFNDATKAYENLQTNQKKFPDFLPNKMTLGVLHAVVGSIPDTYKWGVKLLSGMDGTIQQGQAEIEEVIKYAQNNDYIFEQEALVMYAFLMLHLNNNDNAAWNVVNNGRLKPKESQLACFALANVAMRTGRTDKAIEILQSRPTAAGYYPVHFLDYMTGLAKSFRGDGDADTYFKRFAANFKGRNYLKEVHQRLAWFELLRGNSVGYIAYIEKCKSVGRADIGNDKNALKEAKSGIPPDPILLRARLFFDGGYHQKAYDLLKNKKETDYAQANAKMEYYYRMGRIAHAMKKSNEAILAYNQTIQLGKNSKYYFACASSLQLGIIYEEYKQYEKARQFYNYCLQLNPDDYADSFHAKAKAGVNRVKGK